MKNFLIRVLVYLGLLSFIAFLFMIIIYLHPEMVDHFYRRFTTPKGKSLILGTSRSAQGIKPSIVNARLTGDGNEMINHSFAIGPSSFGPNYLREVKQKIDPQVTNGLYIISVDPWSLTIDVDNIKDDTTLFYEVREKLFVGNLHSSSCNPNFGYLKNYWSNRFSVFSNIFKTIINYRKLIVLHEDGWLEVNIPLNMTEINERIRSSTIEYAEKEAVISATRVDYLSKMIAFLKERGTVLLVRMPVSLPMAELEHLKFPEFSQLMQTVSDRNGIHYFDFFERSGEFQTVDTHHLYKVEAERFSNLLCDSIVGRGIYLVNKK